MSLTFSLPQFSGPTPSRTLQARLRNSTTTSTWLFACTEVSPGEFEVSDQVISPTPPDDVLPYYYEVRDITGTTFDASTLSIRGDAIYGYVEDGSWVGSIVSNGVYHTFEDVFNEGGEDNVKQYARLSADDSDETILDRINSAMLWAEAFIDDWLSNAGKVIPIVGAIGREAQTTTLLAVTAAKLTVVKLYGGRGQNDVQDPNDDEAIMTKSMMRSKEREAHAQLSFWARPMNTSLVVADGVLIGGGAGVV